MAKPFQLLLLAVGVIVLLAVGGEIPVSAHGQPLHISCPRELRAALCDCPTAVNTWSPDL